MELAVLNSLEIKPEEEPIQDNKLDQTNLAQERPSKGKKHAPDRTPELEKDMGPF